MANEDLGRILDKLREWAERIPPTATEFHRRRVDLERQVGENTGFGARNQNQIAEIVRKAQEMEKDVAALTALVEASQRARNQVIEFQAAPAPNAEIRSLVQEWAGEWQDLIDFLLSHTSDRAAAEKASTQMKQIETWATDRKAALAILFKVAALRADEASPALKQALDSALRYWKEEFAAGRTDAKWVAEARGTADRLVADRAAENAAKPVPSSRWDSSGTAAAQPKLAPEPKAPEKDALSVRQSPLPKPAPEPKKVAEAAAPTQPQPPQPAESREEAESGVHFYRMGLVLAECYDLVDALGHSRAEFEALDERYSQLHNREQASTADIKALDQDIQGYRGKLQTLADQRVQVCLQQLRSRWQCFREVYGERPEIAAMVAQSEAAHPEAANSLREFLKLVEAAGQLINSMANAYRPKLAEYVTERVARCRSAVTNLLGEPRTIGIDEELRRLKLPDLPNSGVNADQLFELLDQCQSLLAQIEDLKLRNQTKQDSLRELASRLNGLRSQMASIAEDRGTNLPAVSMDLPADRSLEVTEAELKGVEKLLNAQLSKLHQRLGDSLQKARRGNKAWIKLLAPFVPEVESCVSPDGVPEDLLELRDAVEVENRHRERIGELSTVAAKQLAVRRTAAANQLEHHLSTPAFETHPERETAEEFLEELQAAGRLTEPLAEEAFRGAMMAVIGAEDFIDRIEQVQREIPERLAVLQESFASLRDLNGTAYRKELSKRLNTLIMGARRGVELEQWEQLDGQLKEANQLLAALRRDALQRISAETDELVERLENARRNSLDEVLKRQIQSAFEELNGLGQFAPPPWSLRQQLIRLERRTMRRQSTS